MGTPLSILKIFFFLTLNQLFLRCLGKLFIEIVQRILKNSWSLSLSINVDNGANYGAEKKRQRDEQKKQKIQTTSRNAVYLE